MLTTTLITPSPMQSAQVITEQDAIKILWRYALEREQTFEAYSKSIGYADKKKAVSSPTDMRNVLIAID